MTYTANHKNLASYASYNSPKHNVIVKGMRILQRIFKMIFYALHESRRRQAERELARFAARQGELMTDAVEREMTRRLFASNWGPRA